MNADKNVCFGSICVHPCSSVAIILFFSIGFHYSLTRTFESISHSIRCPVNFAANRSGSGLFRLEALEPFLGFFQLPEVPPRLVELSGMAAPAPSARIHRLSG